MGDSRCCLVSCQQLCCITTALQRGWGSQLLTHRTELKHLFFLEKKKTHISNLHFPKAKKSN